MFQGFLGGLTILADPATLLMLFVGCVLGYVIGVLPGLGGATALSLAMAFTFGMNPLMAMYMYAGIMGSLTLGGAVTAILVNVPGEPGNIMSTIDGFAMTKRGEASRALAISAFASGFGELVGIGILILLIPVVKTIIFQLRSPELFWIMAIGILSIAFVSRGNLLNGLVAGLLGILLSFVGLSPVFGVSRFDLHTFYLRDGVELVPLLVGVFAIAEALGLGTETEDGGGQIRVPVGKERWQQTLMGLKDVLSYPVTFLRCSMIGVIVGIIPGIGASVANALAYTSTVSFVKPRPGERPFGKGNPEGLVACECANNAKDGGALLTTVSFGIPGSPEMVILLGAFTMHGLTPGLTLIVDHADLVWGLIFGLSIAQIITVAWTILGATWFARVLNVRAEFVWLPIILVCSLGSYAIRGNVWDVFLLAASGFLGFSMKRFGFPIIPMVIGFILGVIAENALMQSLMISLGNPAILFTRPLSIIAIAIFLAFAFFPVWASYRSQRRGARPARGETSLSRADLRPSLPGWRERKGALIFDLGLLTVIGAFLYSSILLGPGRGTFPFISSALAFLILMVIILGEFVPGVKRYFETGIEYLVSTGGEGSAQREQEEPAKMSLPIAAMVIGNTLAIYWLGFLLATPLVFLAYFLGGRKMRPSTALIFIVAVWVVLYFGFHQLLQIPLWQGAIPELIPNWLGGDIVPRFF